MKDPGSRPPYMRLAGHAGSECVGDLCAETLAQAKRFRRHAASRVAWRDRLQRRGPASVRMPFGDPLTPGPIADLGISFDRRVRRTRGDRGSGVTWAGPPRGCDWSWAAVARVGTL